jgi:ketosteroid isomerase-like protein
MKKLLTLLAIVVLAACGEEGSQVSADPAGIRDQADNLQVQFNIRDTAAIAAIYAPNGSLMPPNMEAVNGREAIETFWVEFLASGNILAIKGTQVRASGNIGYRVGTFTIASPHNELVDRGKYIEVWHHDGTGWQLMYDIFNSDRPVP